MGKEQHLLSLFRRIVIVVAVLLCSSTARPAIVLDSDPLGPARAFFELEWVKSWDSLGINRYNVSASASDGALVLIVDDGQFLVLNTSSGGPIWKSTWNASTGIMPQLAKDFLIVLNEDFAVEALDIQSGRTRWSTPPIASPRGLMVSGDTAYVLVSAGDVVAFSMQDGSLRWRVSLNGPDWEIVATARVGCVVASETGDLQCLGAYDGRLVWSATFPGIDRSLTAIGRDALFLVDPHWEMIHELALDTGEIRRRYRVGETSQVAGPIFLSRGQTCVTETHLIVVGTAGLANFRAFDRQTGEECTTESVSHGIASLDPLVNGRYVILSTTMSEGDLAVYDTERGFITHRTELGGSGQLIASMAESAFFWTEAGLVRARPRVDELIKISEARVRLPMPRLMVPMIQIGVIVLSALAFALVGRPRIPSTAEASVLLAAILVAWGTLGGLCVATAFVLAKATLVISPSEIGIGFAALLTLPALILVSSYIVTYERKVRRLERSAVRTLNDQQGMRLVVRLFEELRKQMELPTKVRLVFSKARGFSPIAVGPSRRRSRLIVPRNIYTMAMTACKGDEVLAHELLRLVLAHELAHVRNGDVRVLPLLSALRRALPVSVLAILGAFIVIARLEWSDTVVLFARPSVALLVTGSVVLWLLLRAAIGARERLADATAALYVSPKAAQVIAAGGDTGGRPSPLERFIFALSMATPFSSSFMGFAAQPRSRWRAWTRLRRWKPAMTLDQLRDQAEARGKALVTKVHTLDEDQRSIAIGLLAAPIVAALFYACARAMVTLGFLDYMVSIQPAGDKDPLAGFLKAMSLWPKAPEGVPWRLLRQLAPLGAALVIVTLALIPFRDAVRGQVRVVWSAMTSVVVSVVLFAIIFTLIDGWGRPTFVMFPAIRLSVLPVIAWCIVVALAFLGALALRPPQAGRSQPVLREAALVLGCFSVVIAGSLLALRGIPLSARLIWGLIGCMIANVVIGCGALRWLRWHETVPDEWSYCRRVFLRGTRIWSTCIGKGRREKDRLKPLLLEIVSTYALVAFAVVGALYPWLRRLDANYFVNYPARKRELLELLARDPEEIASDRSAFAGEFLPRAIVDSVVGADKLMPSTALGLACLALLTFGIAGTLALDGIRHRSKSGRWLSRISAYGEVRTLLEVPTLPDRHRRGIAKGLSARIRWWRPHLLGGRGIPRMSRTCEVLASACILDIRSERLTGMQDWVRRCERPGGGFSAAPGLPADLAHTTAGLRLLRTIGHEPAYPASQHVTWLNRALDQTLEDQHSIDPSDLIEMLWMAIGATRALHGNRLETLDAAERIAEAATRCWRRSRQRTGETRRVLEILDALERLDQSIRQEIQDMWLPAHERRLVRMSPQSSLPEIVDVLVILRILYPESFRSREAVLQARDSFLKSESSVAKVGGW